MNRQWEMILRSLRKGLEENIRSAVRRVEASRKQDFQDLKRKIDRLADNELVTIRKRMDDIRKSLKRVDALKPYIKAIESATRASRPKKRRARKPRKKKSPKKRTSTTGKTTAKRRIPRK